MSINVTTARKQLYTLVKEVNESHKPITISSKDGDAVMLSGEDWSAIQETMHLLSIPGMRESIIEGDKESLEDCADSLDW